MSHDPCPHCAPDVPCDLEPIIECPCGGRLWPIEWHSLTLFHVCEAHLYHPRFHEARDIFLYGAPQPLPPMRRVAPVD